MLELRLNILNDYVDFFVIVESNETFSGVKKEFSFEKNSHLFDRFKNKIIYHKVVDTPQTFEDKNCDQYTLNLAKESDNVTLDNICWLKEFYQKECIKAALQNIVQDDDHCYISDIDEIWNYKASVNLDDSIYKFNIEYCYIEFLNMRSDENWRYFTGPILTKYKNIKNNCINHIRTYRKMRKHYKYVENGGWHFNALGGIEEKIANFSHPFYTTQSMKLRMTGLYVETTNLPSYILNNMDKYKDLFYDDVDSKFKYSPMKEYSRYLKVDHYKKMIYPFLPNF